MLLHIDIVLIIDCGLFLLMWGIENRFTLYNINSPTMNEAIANAVRNNLKIKFNYEGGSRVIEPHCYGQTTKGNEAVRAYQVSGYSSSGEMGWKMFDLAKASSLEVLPEEFNIRPDYKKGDKGMRKIYIEV